MCRVRVKVTKTPYDMPNTDSVAVECWRTPADFAPMAGTSHKDDVVIGGATSEEDRSP